MVGFYVENIAATARNTRAIVGQQVLVLALYLVLFHLVPFHLFLILFAVSSLLQDDCCVVVVVAG